MNQTNTLILTGTVRSIEFVQDGDDASLLFNLEYQTNASVAYIRVWMTGAQAKLFNQRLQKNTEVLVHGQLGSVGGHNTIVNVSYCDNVLGEFVAGNEDMEEIDSEVKQLLQ